MTRTDLGPRVIASRRGSSVFRRTYEAMMGARERQAQRVVCQYLMALDDETLDRLGYDRGQLRINGFTQPL